MFFREVAPGELLLLSWDFGAFLKRNGYPHAVFTPLAVDGVTVQSFIVDGATVRMGLTATAPNSTFMVGVRADAGELTDSQFKMVHVRAAVEVEPIEPTPVDFELLISAVDGVLLVSAVDGVLLTTG